MGTNDAQLNAALDFSEQLRSLETSLKGERKVRDESGRESTLLTSKLSPQTINELMVLLKSVLSPNTVFSFYNAEYVKTKSFDIWYSCYTLLDSEVRRGNISIDDRDSLLEAIDHSCHSALLRGLAGLTSENYFRSLTTNINVSGQGGSYQPTQVR